MYDIAIIGLGPAGATLARLLNKKYKVVAINYDIKSKCCGGLLSPDAQKELAKFDITIPRNVLVDPQIFSVRTIDFDNSIEKYYQRFYVNMNRKEFDSYLISLIPNNVEIINGLCTKVIQNKSDYDIEVKIKSTLKTIKSKIVIGADGANSIVRKMIAPKNKIKKYTAIQEWYQDNNNSLFYSCIFDKQITDSYCWTISKDKKIIIGGAFKTEDCNEKFELLKEKCKTLGMKFNKKLKREGCFVYITHPFNIKLGRKRAYLIGEAAGFISPSSLEGISYAINTAYKLSRCINDDMLNITRRYYISTLNLRIKILFKMIKKPFMYNKYLRKIVMLSGIKAIKKK